MKDNIMIGDIVRINNDKLKVQVIKIDNNIYTLSDGENNYITTRDNITSVSAQRKRAPIKTIEV